MTPFDFSVRVYYEDTDLAGLVYYANYLRFIERARSELLRSLGVDQAALKHSDNTVFVVRHVTLDYHKPARYDDLLTIRTTLTALTGARLNLSQKVLRDQELLVDASVTLACLTGEGRPTRLPAKIHSLLNTLLI